LVYLLSLGYITVFTQANDYSDLRGEQLALKTVFEDNIYFLFSPIENPFSAVTRYHEPGKKETAWSSSNTHLYAMQGWKDKGKTPSIKDVKGKLKSAGGQKLLKELLSYVN